MYYAQYLRLNLHVYATPRQVVRAAHALLSPLGKSRPAKSNRHAWLRRMLDLHKQAQHIATLAGAL